ncbi:MAG: Fe-S cluster assembly protein NifU [Anaerohalosphaeraceae bacterium]
MWDYTDKVMDHFANPRNVGKIDNYDGIGEVGSLACGDALTLTFKLDKGGRIADVKFQTFGCASAIASSSVLTEIIKGMTLEEAEKVTNQQIADKLGGLPEQKMHCSVMGQEALEAAIAYYRNKGKSSPHKEGKVVCTCFGVTDQEIRRVIQENDLTTVEQVTNFCKAGGGCGGCHGEIGLILQDVQGQKKGLQPQAAAVRPKKLSNIQKIQLIQETIREQIRPVIRSHGGDLELVDVDGNKVIVALRGMCASCKMSEVTMKDLVQAKLREFVAEDLYVEQEKDPTQA